MKTRKEATTTTKEKAPEPAPESIEQFVEHSPFPTHPRLLPGLERMVSSTLELDVEKVFKQLKADLKIEGTHLGDRGTVSIALNDAEVNALEAHRLYCVAFVAREEWDERQKVVVGAMRSRATMELQLEKDKGTRSKAITEADVEGRAMEKFPDEWEYASARRAKVHRMVEHTKELLECWRSRAASLRVLLETRR